jgi:CRISPR type I-E-associated protein CasB/Cse2
MSEQAKIAKSWWSALNNKEHVDRAALAKLRRCENAVEAATVLQGLRLARKLGCDKPGTQDARAALELAILLAHVREDDPLPLMRAAGWKSFPGDKKETDAPSEQRPLLSELRFRRLLQTTRAERLEAFKRLVHQLKGKARVADLTDSYLNWDDKVLGDKVRERWAFDYYAASAAKSDTDTNQGAVV